MNKNFKDLNNIFFIEENDIQIWVDKISSILNTDKEDIDKIFEEND